MKTQHTHKLELTRVGSKGYIIYKCAEPNCSHYMPTIAQSKGKLTKCWGPECDNVIAITQEMITDQIKHPMCNSCRELRKKQKEALALLPEE